MNEDPKRASGDPYKTGYADATLGRPCESPWKDQGYKAIRRNALYLQGYMDGEDRRYRTSGLQEESTAL